MDKFYTYKGRYGIEHICLKKGNYSYNGNICIMAVCHDGAPYANITVNVCDLPYGIGTIDTNNLGDGIVDWLESIGAGNRTGEVKESGFCSYPVFTFDDEFIKSLDYIC